MKKNYLALAAILSCLAVYSQKSNLQVGDKIPDIYLGKFLDQPNKKLKLSQVNAKLLVLDFWNTECGTCLHDMPRMDSLQKEFNGRIQIVAITRNSEQEVKKLFSKIKLKRPDYPFVVGDVAFRRFFPHQGDPIHIWIDKNRVIKAITFYYNTNTTTVAQFLSGTDPKLARRWDYGFNWEYPLLSEKNTGLFPLTSSYSILMNNMYETTDAMGSWIEITRIKAVNVPLLDLFKLAYIKDLYEFPVKPYDLWMNNRIAVEVGDTSRFLPPRKSIQTDAWRKLNSYGYELQVPQNDSDEKFSYMRVDLARYFPYKAKIERRKTKCLALVVTNEKSIPLAVQPNSKPMTEVQNVDFSLILQNAPISDLLGAIFPVNRLNALPLVDETGFTGKINLKLKSPLYDIPTLRKELQEYGLDLVDGEWPINILVITDKL